MSAAIWVGLAVGGALGAMTRFTVDARVRAALARRRTARLRKGKRVGVVPLGTIVVNLTACFLLGLLTAMATTAPPWLHAVAGTGFLGGYSTFSTAVLEAARLMRDGHGDAATAHALVMTAGTLAAAAAGLWLGAAWG